MVEPKVPQLPGGPDPDRPVPRDPVQGFDLNAYAAVAVELAGAPSRRADILRAHELDELRWAKIEQTWLLRVAVALMQGDRELAAALDDARDRAVRRGEDASSRPR